jgi:peptidoglycan-N-acetylglucosamine deacetylase
VTRLALTIDDAPTIEAGGTVAAVPARMDSVRRALQEAGARSCVAFVIGSHAVGEERRLERWLEAGFELGNHTYDHRHASSRTLAECVASIQRCDEVLGRVGAFHGGRRRWFRWPYLDRGRDPAFREQAARAIAELGYREVPVTVDLYDYRYEHPLSAALKTGDEKRVRAIGARFTKAAVASVRRVDRLARASVGRPRRHLALFHFGEVASVFAQDLLARLRAHDVTWCDVDEALSSPGYAEYCADHGSTGRVGGTWTRSLGERGLRHAVRGIHLVESLWPASAGPRWPHLE